MVPMAEPLRVQLVTSAPLPRQQLPGGSELVFDNVQLILTEETGEYDWLIVCHDLAAGRQRTSRVVHCPRAHTVFITYEPSSVTLLSEAFLQQFGHVISCHEPHTVAHENVRFAAPPLLSWGYDTSMEYEQIAAAPMPDKTKTLSTFCSEKSMSHTLHRQRLLFTRKLQAQLPELEVFGPGAGRVMQHKRPGIDPYRYHLVVENSLCPHYWTEKLSDAFLGWSLPFYVGAPNVCNYFPEQSLVQIDICNFRESLARIRRAIADNEYERRLPAIREARRRVLEEYNFFRYLAASVQAIAQNTGAAPEASEQAATPWLLHSRRVMNSHPYHGLRHLTRKIRNRARRHLEYARKRRRFTASC